MNTLVLIPSTQMRQHSLTFYSGAEEMTKSRPSWRLFASLPGEIDELQVQSETLYQENKVEELITMIG